MGNKKRPAGGLGMDRGGGMDRGLGSGRSIIMDRGLGMDRGIGMDRGQAPTTANCRPWPPLGCRQWQPKEYFKRSYLNELSFGIRPLKLKSLVNTIMPLFN